MSAAATTEAQSFKVPARYRFQKHLGSGSYGVVSSFHDSERGRDVAIKRVKKVFDNYLVLRRTLREIRLMSHFRHPNLLRLHKVLPLEPTGGDLYLSIELMDCDLDTLIHTKRVVLTDQQVRCFTAQLFLGLMAMHAGHVIHRDLKPANIFVRLNRGQVKIGDLGLSRGIGINAETGEASHPSDELLTEYVVTRWYRAPEVLLARSKYGPPVDVWSVGCIVYEMCSRKALFAGKNSYDQLKRILAVIGCPSEADSNWVPRESMPLLQKCVPSGGSSHRGQSFASLCNVVCSSDGVDLLNRMCLFDPGQRIGIEQALLHPYLAGITSEQDRKTARAIDPADVTYDKIFDGVGRQGEGAALIQLGRLMRREVAKFNPVRMDTSPERSQAERSTPKTANTSRTPRGGPQSTVEALVNAGMGGRSSGSTKALTEQHVANSGSSDRASSAQLQQPELTASVWHRRRSEPEADVWARRSGQGTIIPAPSRTSAPSSSVPITLSSRRRQPAEEPSSARTPFSLPGPPPADGPVPPAAFWLSEDKSPSSKPIQRNSMRTECSAGSVPSLRRRVPACSGGSATTGSTRATPVGSRPGTEANSRASSRIASTSRARIPSVGPHWAAEAEGFLVGPAGPMDAATASPRAGPPMLYADSQRQPEEAHRRQNCWLASDDAGDSSKPERSSQSQAERRSLRECAAASHPGLPPDLSHAMRHQSHSLASLDGVLREMKAMIRNAPDDALREERLKHTGMAKTSSSSKLSSRGSARHSTGLRGHRAAAVGRGHETTEDRSPSSQRASHRRHPPSARTERGEERRSTSRGPCSHDELDFAVSEPFAADNAVHVNVEVVGHGEAPTPPWAEARRPLESLEPESVPSPERDGRGQADRHAQGHADRHGQGQDLGPPVPWARGSSVRTLQDGDQDWKTLQSSWNSAVATGSGKAHASGAHQRQISRTNSSAKRATAASENDTSNRNNSGLGFIF